MKKTYSKPEIMFESFMISSSIAGTCNVDLEDKQEEIGFNVFTSELACTVPGNDGDHSVCYHGPEGFPTLIGS